MASIKVVVRNVTHTMHAKNAKQIIILMAKNAQNAPIIVKHAKVHPYIVHHATTDFDQMKMSTNVQDAHPIVDIVILTMNVMNATMNIIYQQMSAKHAQLKIALNAMMRIHAVNVKQDIIQTTMNALHVVITVLNATQQANARPASTITIKHRKANVVNVLQFVQNVQAQVNKTVLNAVLATSFQVQIEIASSVMKRAQNVLDLLMMNAWIKAVPLVTFGLTANATNVRVDVQHAKVSNYAMNAKKAFILQETVLTRIVYHVLQDARNAMKRMITNAWNASLDIMKHELVAPIMLSAQHVQKTANDAKSKITN